MPGERSSSPAFTFCSGQSVGMGTDATMPRHGPPTALIFTPILIVFVCALPIFGPLAPVAAAPFEESSSNCALAGEMKAMQNNAIAEYNAGTVFRTETLRDW